MYVNCTFIFREEFHVKTHHNCQYIQISDVVSFAFRVSEEDKGKYVYHLKNVQFRTSVVLFCCPENLDLDSTKIRWSKDHFLKLENLFDMGQIISIGKTMYKRQEQLYNKYIFPHFTSFTIYKNIMHMYMFIMPYHSRIS